MSTLKVNTIQDSSGSNASTTEQINQGRAKVWIHFDGQDTVAIRDSFNVSSLTDNGTGDYTYSFTSGMSNTNYAICATAANTSAGQPVVSACPANDEQTTSQFNVEQGYTTNTSSYSNFDSEDYVSIFGDLA